MKFTMRNPYTVLDAANFEKGIEGKKVRLFTLQNKNGLIAKITNYGGKLVQLLVPDRQGELGDIVLGYDTLEKAVNGQASMGAVIGRYANRIANGRFVLDGQAFQLSLNGKHHLHGGVKGSRFQVLAAEQLDSRCLRLTYCFRDGEEGYPGNCEWQAVYTLTDQDELAITYAAVTDKPTVVNFTNHAFFNLAGQGDILGHELTLHADYFTPVDESLIPTGEIKKVEGTPLDFTKPMTIGSRIGADCDQLKLASGYDLNFVLNKSRHQANLPELAAHVYEPVSGRVMEIYTTEPGIQLYSGHGLSGQQPRDEGKGGQLYQRCSGFCLETQHFPDSPNQAHFPSTVLRPGERFFSATIHKFSVRD